MRLQAPSATRSASDRQLWLTNSDGCNTREQDGGLAFSPGSTSCGEEMVARWRLGQWGEGRYWAPTKGTAAPSLQNVVQTVTIDTASREVETAESGGAQRSPEGCPIATCRKANGDDGILPVIPVGRHVETASV